VYDITIRQRDVTYRSAKVTYAEAVSERRRTVKNAPGSGKLLHQRCISSSVTDTPSATYCSVCKHSHWPNRSAFTHLFPGALGQTRFQFRRPKETALSKGTSTLAYTKSAEIRRRESQLSETSEPTYYLTINCVINLRGHHNLPDETDHLFLTQQFSTFRCSRNGMEN
jgi:hypothetical protein